MRLGALLTACTLFACRGERAAPVAFDAAPPSSVASIPSAPRDPQRPPDMEALTRAQTGIRARGGEILVEESARTAICDNRSGVEKAFNVRIVTDPLDDAAPFGTRIFGVRTDSFFGRLGLVNGDLLTAVDDIPLFGATLDDAINRLCAARTATLHVWRDYKDAGASELRLRVVSEE